MIRELAIINQDMAKILKLVIERITATIFDLKPTMGRIGETIAGGLTNKIVVFARMTDILTTEIATACEMMNRCPSGSRMELRV